MIEAKSGARLHASSFARSRSRQRGFISRAIGFLVTLFLALLAVALVTGGTVALHTRAQMADPVAALPPITVMTGTVSRQTAYDQQRRFVGRVESARQTDLAFERAGRLIELTVDEGQVVVAGQIMARLDTRALRTQRDEQRAARRALVTDRELAMLEAQRQRQLTGDGFASAQAFDAARLRVAGLDARLEQSDAALQSIEIDLSKTVLRAPFDATVGQLMLEQGSMVSTGAPVLVLFERAAPQIRVGLPRQLADGLQPSQVLDVTVGNVALRARLVQLRPDLDARTQTVAALLQPEVTAETDYRLLYGETAHLVLEDTVAAEGFWLPLTALKEGVRGLWTMSVVRTGSDDALDGVLAQAAVEVLHVDGENAYVRAGVPDGERYVKTGLHRLVRGETVRFQAGGAK